MRVAVFRFVAGAPNREFGSLSRIGCYTEKKRTISFEKSALDDKSLRAFYIWDGTMNALLEKYNDYLRLVGCTGEYNHLGIAKDIVACTRYFETFFHEYTDKYLLGQTIVKVKTFRILDSNGNAFIEDSF